MILTFFLTMLVLLTSKEQVYALPFLLFALIEIIFYFGIIILLP